MREEDLYLKESAQVTSDLNLLINFTVVYQFMNPKSERLS